MFLNSFSLMSPPARRHDTCASCQIHTGPGTCPSPRFDGARLGPPRPRQKTDISLLHHVKVFGEYTTRPDCHGRIYQIAKQLPTELSQAARYLERS